MQPSLTTRERAIFTVKQPVEHDKYWYVYPLIITIMLIILIGTICDVFGLTSIAHAETIPVYHDNAYYCASIEAGTIVVGATHAELKSICPNIK